MIVLDASALVDVVADRPLRDWVLQHLEGHEIVAPAHQLAEVSSALIRLLRAGELTPAETRRALDDAAALRQRTIPIDRPALTRAFELRESIRILDGLYVALAEQHDCALVTTDARLARANPPCSVMVPHPEH